MPRRVDARRSLRDLLAQGRRGETGHATTIARDVLDAPGFLLPLLDLLDDADPAVVAHAAHAVMQVAADRPDLFQPHADRLIDRLDPPAQWEIGEQLPKIVCELDLTPVQAARLAAVLEGRLEDRSAIAAASALSALVRLAERGLADPARVRGAHAAALASSSKALAARARRMARVVQRLG